MIKSKINKENEQIWRKEPRKQCTFDFRCVFLNIFLNLLYEFPARLPGWRFTARSAWVTHFWKISNSFTIGSLIFSIIFKTHNLDYHHCITIREKVILFLYCLFICLNHMIFFWIRRNKHHQSWLWHVEISNQTIWHFKMIWRINEFISPPGFSSNCKTGNYNSLQCSDSGCPHSPYFFLFMFGFINNLSSF